MSVFYAKAARLEDAAEHAAADLARAKSDAETAAAKAAEAAAEVNRLRPALTAAEAGFAPRPRARLLNIG